jgi:hypothetical protein
MTATCFPKFSKPTGDTPVPRSMGVPPMSGTGVDS